jgi:hypothetical protein
MPKILTDAERFGLLDPICQGLNALKGSADEAAFLRETSQFVAKRVELAERMAQVVAMPGPRQTRIRVLEIQILMLSQELEALKQRDSARAQPNASDRCRSDFTTSFNF